MSNKIIQNLENKGVSWVAFIWVVGIFTVLLGAVWTIQIQNMQTLSDLRSDISVVKNDVTWIRQTIKNESLSLK